MKQRILCALLLFSVTGCVSLHESPEKPLDEESYVLKITTMDSHCLERLLNPENNLVPSSVQEMPEKSGPFGSGMKIVLEYDQLKDYQVAWIENRVIPSAKLLDFEVERAGP